ncbi:MAG: LysE family transporter [Sedimentisphaerales bacterium]|nr:LysE family transporter [Sedimentisphaerales bacterium]
MELLFFLAKVVGISLSGVMAPGPVTAAAIAMGARNRFAGVLMAIGHGIVEFPLIILITLGMGVVLKSPATKIVIGFAGGVFLLFMAIQMMSSLRGTEDRQVKVSSSGPLVAGIILSGGNPFFLIWWASVGLNLAITAAAFGVWAFVLFAIVHWLCDLIWLSALSWAAFKGSVLLGPSRQKKILLVCSLALFGFGLFFIYNAADILLGKIS